MADRSVERAPSAVPVHDALIPFEVASLDLRGRHDAVDPERPLDVVTDRLHRVERPERILEDHLHL